MANKDNLLKLVAQKLGPDNLKQMVDQAQQAIGQDPDVTPEVIDEIIAMFEFVAENPEEYQSVVKEAIQTGAMDEGDLPPEFDPTTIAVILLAFYGLRDRMGGQQPQQMPQMAKGGLSKVAQQLQSAGTGNDSILAHISPIEADMLRRRGGAGSINPITGLREYGFFKKVFKAVKSVVKAVVPIAKAVLPMVANYFVPGSGAFVGAALGATGGGGLKGALMGGLGGYLSTPGNSLTSNIGSYANNAINNFGGLSNEVLGSGILGGASSAIMGKNPITGALLSGAVANYAPGMVDKYGDTLPTGMAQNIATGAGIGANTGGGLKGTLSGGAAGALTNLAMSGLANMGIEPSSTSTGAQNFTDPNAAPNQIVGGTDLQMPTYADGAYSTPATPTNPIGGQQFADSFASSQNANPLFQPEAAGALTQTAQAGVAPVVKPAAGFKMADIVPIAMLGGLLGGKTPAQASQAIQQDPALTAQQKEGMLRSLTNYTFDPGMTTFPQQGTPEWDTLMNNLSQGMEQTYATPTLTEQKAKGGKTRRQPQGALSQVSRLSLGAGDGRSDSIEARLSDGEYVIDAETVALLGNGSTKAGAAMLDQMRQGIRQQKGRALAKGKFSPDAKSPLAYMKGGLR